MKDTKRGAMRQRDHCISTAWNCIGSSVARKSENIPSGSMLALSGSNKPERQTDRETRAACHTLSKASVRLIWGVHAPHGQSPQSHAPTQLLSCKKRDRLMHTQRCFPVSVIVAVVLFYEQLIRRRLQTIYINKLSRSLLSFV